MRDSIVNGLNNIELLTHSLVSSLSNLPSNIINLLEQLFNKLFVPTDTPFDDIKNIFNTKYPIINQITDITSGLFGEYGDTDTPPQFFVTINGKQCNILSLDWYAPYLKNCPVIRAMPNINAVVGMSATAVTPNAISTTEQVNIAVEMFSAIGEVYPISEKLFSAFSALCGSSVAFTFMYMDALASAGVKAGFPKKQALEFAMQSVAGCAVMLSASGKSPSELVDMICSPGGTTIEGVHKIRELGFENAVYKGIDAIIEKDKKI